MAASPKVLECEALVIGTGVGGATLGHALAKAGWKVVFCDQGKALSRLPDACRGDFAEMFFDRPAVPTPRHAPVLARAGRWSAELEDRSPQSRPTRHVPFLGEGEGGSSALYGMAFERFRPADFEPGKHHPKTPDPQVGSLDLPDAWPITYEALRPYYRQAEKLYRVRGTLDPRCGHLDPLPAGLPPALTAAGEELYQFLAGKKMHPYRLPAACEWVEGCLGCQGFLCPKACKNDSARICLLPAIEQHGATFLDECRVEAIEAEGGEVTAVHGVRHGEAIRIRARVVILAAGALRTPQLLLRSRSAAWPNGLANRSGLVGKYLMRHFIDLFAVGFKEAKAGVGSNLKELAFNDFYHYDQDKYEKGKYGTIQSFGALPPAPVLTASLIDDVRHAKPWLTPLVRLAEPALRRFLDRKLSRSVLMASVLEDLPYADNAVSLGAEGELVIRYQVPQEARQRIATFRRMIVDTFKPYPVMVLKQAENNQRLAHVCGTCRFGEDPATSVLDRHNKAHDLANLYVVDSSFFPSSAGMNPALTIAANALRVADHLTGSGQAGRSVDQKGTGQPQQAASP